MIKRQKNFNGGMTYVELIVVLSIFSIMSAIGLFNYKEFQVKVDIKNLANDIALKFVQAQKESLSGKLPPPLQQPPDPLTWKPSYGLYFTMDSPSLFIYFVDLDQDKTDDTLVSCPVDECLEIITITKGNAVPPDGIQVFETGGGSSPKNEVHITFTRPDSRATIECASCVNPEHVEITVASPQGVSSKISIFASGRIQIN